MCEAGTWGKVPPEVGAFVPRMSAKVSGACGKEEHRRVLIIEDHQMLAEALALSLSARGFHCSIARLEGKESILGQAASYRPGLVLLDLDLGGDDGLELLPPLRAAGARVLVLTGYSDEPRLARSVALGANGWVSKSEPFERLIDASELTVQGLPLMAVGRREQLVTLGRANLMAEYELKQQMAELTQREHEVLEALRDGKIAEEIADSFFISVGTVRSHIRGILTKLGVSSQLAAVAKARDRAVLK